MPIIAMKAIQTFHKYGEHILFPQRARLGGPGFFIQVAYKQDFKNQNGMYRPIPVSQIRHKLCVISLNLA